MCNTSATLVSLPLPTYTTDGDASIASPYMRCRRRCATRTKQQTRHMCSCPIDPRPRRETHAPTERGQQEQPPKWHHTIVGTQDTHDSHTSLTHTMHKSHSATVCTQRHTHKYSGHAKRPLPLPPPLLWTAPVRTSVSALSDADHDTRGREPRELYHDGRWPRAAQIISGADEL